MKPVLYLGDTGLSSAAGYLAGVMTAAGIGFDYVPSDQPVETAWLEGRRLVILSDYPSRLLPLDAHLRLAALVTQGTGLLMIGGWESFHGLGGDWDRSPVAAVLPVAISAVDDRVNCAQPAIVHPAASHPAVDGLPWSDQPPGVGGFNRFAQRPHSQLLLELVLHTARWEAGRCEIAESERVPLLVVGQHGAGRTAALATDVAPHWVGGLVDWGDVRLTAQATGAGEIEVGQWYARFFQQLVRWTGALEGK